MLFLIQNGYTDVASMMFYQTLIKGLVMSCWDAAFAPNKLMYEPDLDSFIYTFDQVTGVV